MVDQAFKHVDSYSPNSQLCLIFKKVHPLLLPLLIFIMSIAIFKKFQVFALKKPKLKLTAKVAVFFEKINDLLADLAVAYSFLKKIQHCK